MSDVCDDKTSLEVSNALACKPLQIPGTALQIPGRPHPCQDAEKRLWLEASRGNVDDVRRLLSAGAVNCLEGWEHSTPLQKASANGHKDVVRALLDAGADPCLADKDGRTPLYWAANNGHRDVVRLLLEREADPTEPDNWGWNPLHAAAIGGHKEVVQLLLEGGANPHEVDKRGRTPLDWALILSQGDRMDLLQLLLDWHCPIPMNHDIMRKFLSQSQGGVPMRILNKKAS